MTDVNTLNVSFPLTYVSQDNHPDDGIVAKSVLEKVLGHKLTMEELDFEQHGGHAWKFDLSERRYFIIAYCDLDTNKWSQEFGDYSKTCCKEELSEMRDNADSGQKMRYRMFETTDAQPTIDALLAKLGELPKIAEGQSVIFKGVKGKIDEVVEDKVIIKLNFAILNKFNRKFAKTDMKWDYPSQTWRVGYNVHDFR